MASLYQWKAWARNVCARAGLRKRRRPDTATRLLQRHQVNVVFDVGANKGQYARDLLRMGYTGRIVSFEPQSEAFHKLQANAWGYASWRTERFAIGGHDGPSLLNVAGNSQSSSLLDMLPQHLAAAPESHYVGQETIHVRRLDSIVDQYSRADERCFLKLDVQGFEGAVLRGAERSLARCVGVQLEMSLVPLYGGEVLFDEMLQKMSDLGYCLTSLSSGFADPRTGQLLQVDGVFYQKQLMGLSADDTWLNRHAA
jgi:FkbM family methyltransferase